MSLSDSQHPDANIGIATGAPTGFFALDVDPKNGGKDNLAKLKAEHGDLPDTVEQVTGGGWHYLFKHVNGVACSAGKLAPGLDIRGDDWLRCSRPVPDDRRVPLARRARARRS